MRARVLMFHMSISSETPFHGYTNIFNLWPWPCKWSLAYFIRKMLTLLIHVACQKGVLKLSYFTWVFLCPCDLKHLWNWPLSGASVFHKHILWLGTRTHKPLKPSQKVIVKASANLRKKFGLGIACLMRELMDTRASFLIELSSRKNIYFLLIKRSHSQCGSFYCQSQIAFTAKYSSLSKVIK